MYNILNMFSFCNYIIRLKNMFLKSHNYPRLWRDISHSGKKMGESRNWPREKTDIVQI